MSTNSSLLKFQYRASTRKIYLWTVGLLLLSCIIIVRIRMVEVLEEETVMAVGKLMLACSVPLSILIRLVFFVQPRIFSSYEVSETDFFRVRGRARHHFSFDNIVAVKISLFSPRFLGGFSVRMKSGQKLIFLSALKDSHLILERIISRRPELLKTEKVQQYLTQSRRVDVSWKRLKEKTLNWRLLVAKYVATPLLITIVAWLNGIQLSNEYSIFEQWIYLYLLFVILFFLIGGIGNALEEKLVLSKTLWNDSSQSFDRNLSFEKKIAHFVNGLFLLVATGIIFLITSWS